MKKRNQSSKGTFWLALLAVLSMFVANLSGTLCSIVAQEKVTITYGIWDSRQEPGLRQIADDFEKANPNIKVDIQVTGWDEYWTMLEAAATGGALPDVFWMHSNEIYKYAVNDMLLEMDAMIEQDSVDLSKFPKGLVEIYHINDKQYALPKDFDTIALWYNKKMFDEAGLQYPNETWTWDDLKEAAKKLTKEDKSQYGITTQLVNQEGYYNYVYSNGGTILTEERKSGYDDPKTIEALEFYFSFVHEGLSPMSYKDGDSRAFLENGVAAMGTFGSWQLSAFLANDYLRENFDVAALPMKDGKRVSIYNGLGNAIAANTAHKDEAWKFVAYLSSKEAQEKAAELGVAISAYEGTAETWVNSNKDFNLQVFIDMVKDGQIRPYTNNTTAWEERAYETLKGAYTGEKTVKEAAAETAKMMNEVIAEEE